MKLPHAWLTDLVNVSADAEAVATALALRGFEVASVEQGRHAVIDFEITANRPDCLSIIGLAREASAAFGVPLQLPDRTMPPAGQPQPIEVTIDDAELCPRYCAQVFEIRSNGSSPSWMQERLEAAGVRSISAIVDVTNYVMLEMGQPTHAFDYGKLAGRALRIRRAKPGEKLRTLDDMDRELQPDMLVIADAERAQAIGGVMGGASSEIGATTKLMVLESAYFKPASIRRTSKRLNLKTEASTRFERGADVNAAPIAIARAAALLQQIGAAQPLGPVIDKYPSPIPARTLTLRSSRIERVLGMAVSDAEVVARLEPLGFSVASARPAPRTPHPAPRASHPAPRASDVEPPSSVWEVSVPSYRVDVLREVDLIEEVARHDGYASLPATIPEMDAVQPPPDPRTLLDRRLRQLLSGCGLSEAMTFAFIEASAAEPFGGPDTIVKVANPLSEKFAVLRPSLLPGLIDAASHNRRHGRTDVRLFEVGARFGASAEVRAVAGIWCGAGSPAHWSGAARPADFYDVKGVVEMLGRAFGLELEYEPAEISYLVSGRCASVVFRLKPEATNDEGVASGFGRKTHDAVASGFSRKIHESRTVGLIGQIAPSILEKRGLPANDVAWAFELDTDALAQAAADDLRASSLPRFPSIVRDLSVLVDSALPAAAVRGTIRSSAPSTLVDVIEFDRYRGKGVPEGRVSLSLRLTFRSPDRTLTDAEVDQAMDAVVAALGRDHGASRR